MLLCLCSRVSAGAAAAGAKEVCLESTTSDGMHRVDLTCLWPAPHCLLSTPLEAEAARQQQLVEVCIECDGEQLSDVICFIVGHKLKGDCPQGGGRGGCLGLSYRGMQGAQVSRGAQRSREVEQVVGQGHMKTSGAMVFLNILNGCVEHFGPRAHFRLGRGSHMRLWLWSHWLNFLFVQHTVCLCAHCTSPQLCRHPSLMGKPSLSFQPISKVCAGPYHFLVWPASQINGATKIRDAQLARRCDVQCISH